MLCPRSKSCSSAVALKNDDILDPSPNSLLAARHKDTESNQKVIAS